MPRFSKGSVRSFFALFVVVTIVFAVVSGAAAKEIASGRMIQLRAGTENAYTRIGPPPAYYNRMSGLNANAGANIQVTYNGFSAQAQAAFQHAVNIWAALVNSNVPIKVTATWEPLGAGVLGSAGSPWIVRNFANAPVPNVWYHQAVANSLSGVDEVTATDDPVYGGVDILASFNSSFSSWYMGTDGMTPAGQWDFVTVVIHELCHGLGFSGFADPFTPTMLLNGSPTIYSTFVETGGGTNVTSLSGAGLTNALLGGDLWFNGPNAVTAFRNNHASRIKIYAPNPWESGSSFSHFDETTYPAGTDGSLMTPFLDPAEAAHSPGAHVLGVFDDVGWNITPPVPITVDMTVNGSDGPITINKGDTLTIRATITDAANQQGDYFLVALYKGMFWTYKFASKTWVPGQSATFQGPLVNLSGKKVFQSSKLPPGKIVFYLAVDQNQNNAVDMGSLSWDKAIVRIQ
jgi:hypothetical protein